MFSNNADRLEYCAAPKRKVPVVLWLENCTEPDDNWLCSDITTEQAAGWNSEGSISRLFKTLVEVHKL